MCFYLSVFHHQKITLFYFWNTYVWSLVPSSYHGIINQKIEKTKNILVFKKVTQLVARALVVERKRKILVKVKPQHWSIFIIWKRTNKIKAIKSESFYGTESVTLKVLCHWQSQILELLRYFENTELLKQILNNAMSFVIAKNRSSST